MTTIQDAMWAVEQAFSILENSNSRPSGIERRTTLALQLAARLLHFIETKEDDTSLPLHGYTPKELEDIAAALAEGNDGSLIL